jgi:hypothetical protein
VVERFLWLLIGRVMRQCCWKQGLFPVAIPGLPVCLWWVVAPGGRAEAAHRLRISMVVGTAGCVGCRRSWYCVCVEMSCDNPGTCADFF